MTEDRIIDAASACMYRPNVYTTENGVNNPMTLQLTSKKIFQIFLCRYELKYIVC